MFRNRVVGLAGIILASFGSSACRNVDCDPADATCEPLVLLLYSCVPELVGGNLQGCPLALSGTVTTIGGQANVTGTADGIGTTATFSFPNGFTTDGSFIYIADANGASIRRLDPTTRAITTVVTGLNLPRDVVYEAGALYIADASANKILRYNLASGALMDFAGDGTNAFLDGFGTSARFFFPQGITSDGSYLYVVDSGNIVIRKIDLNTAEVTRLAGVVGSNGFTDGDGSIAEFNGAAGVTLVGTKLYVADGNNDIIREVDSSTGFTRTIAGSAGSPGFANGIHDAARFDFPFGMSTDGSFLYIADVNNHSIRRLDLGNLEVTQISGQGGGSGGTIDGIGGGAVHKGPRGITSDGRSLYIGDSQSETLRLIE